jgi:hypothetical protein
MEPVPTPAHCAQGRVTLLGCTAGRSVRDQFPANSVGPRGPKQLDLLVTEQNGDYHLDGHRQLVTHLCGRQFLDQRKQARL